MLDHLKDKIHSFQSAAQQCREWQSKGEKIVFTNGCFDLLHYGHIHYLNQARMLGNRLVVGLNSDTSVRRLKGVHRPIKDEQSRIFTMAALACVDSVVVFEEDTPYDLIKTVQPDILVKGGDWAVEDIVGADLVLAKGGLVKSLTFVKGFSTTSLEEKIKKQSK